MPIKQKLKKVAKKILKHKVAIHAGAIGAIGGGLAVAGRANLQKRKKKEETE